MGFQHNICPRQDKNKTKGRCFWNLYTIRLHNGIIKNIPLLVVVDTVVSWGMRGTFWCYLLQYCMYCMYISAWIYEKKIAFKAIFLDFTFVEHERNYLLIRKNYCLFFDLKGLRKQLHNHSPLRIRYSELIYWSSPFYKSAAIVRFCSDIISIESESSHSFVLLEKQMSK